MARLVVDSGPDEGMIFSLTQPVTTLGRSPSNAIQVPDKRASRFHAEIVRRGNSFEIRDLKSKNGTIVKGVKLTEPCVLRHGDQIRIGQTLFVFEDEEPAATGTRAGSSSSAIRLADKTPTQTRDSVPAGLSGRIETTIEQEKPPDRRGDTHRRLEVLLRVIEKVRSDLDLDRMLDDIVDLVFDVFQPERSAILLLDRETGALVPRIVKTLEGDEEISISRTILHRAIQERMALLISDAATDERFKAAESVVAQRIRTAICAPLSTKDEVLGVLYIDSRTSRVNYGREDLELLTGIADQAAMAISNALLHEKLVEQHRLERELEIARTIQMNLLPKQPPLVPGFDIAAMTVPAKRVGGDYYDFIEIDPDRLGIVVADVSGKGVPAALLTASIRAALQVEARRPENRIETIISNLNAMACRDAANNMFVALFFGILQLSSRRFRYINAGHCFPFVIDSEGIETRLDKGGCVLGVLPEREYESGEVKLSPRSTLLIYSDGVTDVLNERNEAFGLDRLRQIVSANLDSTAEALREKIFDATNKFKGRAEQFDDYTLVIVKVL